MKKQIKFGARHVEKQFRPIIPNDVNISGSMIRDLSKGLEQQSQT